MKKLLLLIFLATVLRITTFAQTVPTAQTLPYSQDFSALAANATAFPAGWIGWTLSAAPSGTFNTAAPSADRVLTASSSASTTSGNVHNYNGKIGFLNNGSLDLALALNINTTGKQKIVVSYKISTIRNAVDATNTRVNGVILQYRVGTTGAFTEVPGAELYQNNLTPQTTGTAPLNEVTHSFSLPVACENQADVQLRWVSKQISGGGGRPSFAIDNVSIDQDNTAPTFTSTFPSATGISSSGFDLNTNINEKGKTYYVILPSGAAAPTAAQVKAGQNAASGTVTLAGTITNTAASTLYSTAITGLTASTTYDIYLALEDLQLNLQTTPTLLSASTLAATSPEIVPSVATLTFTGYTAINKTSSSSFTLAGNNLSADVELTATGDYTLSKDNSTFTSSISFTAATFASNGTGTVYVKFSPTTAGTKNSSVSITSTGAPTKTVDLIAIAIDPLNQDFNSASYLSNSGWSQISVKGSAKTWEYTSTNPHLGAGAAYANGFAETQTETDGTQPSDDWLVSPKMDLTTLANYSVLNFWSRKFFVGADIKVYVSTTHNGSNTITPSDWIELTNPGLPSTTGVWVKSNNIDISAYKTTSTYVAFRYVTDNSGSSNAAEWRVDDFSVSNQTGSVSIPALTLELAETAVGGTSASKNFSFSASGYGDVTVTAPTDFEVSTDNTNFQTAVVVPAANAVGGQTIHVRFKPSTTAAVIAGALNFTATGLATAGPQVKGSSILKSSTFDLASWNMEFFGNGTTIPNFGPANRTLQISNASTVYNKVLPDVIGIQEISDETAVDALLATLPATYKKKISQVYSYSIKPNTSTDPFPEQKIGFIYNSATVDTVGFRVMFVDMYKGAVNNTDNRVTDSFWSSGRLPFMGVFDVISQDGLKQRVNVVVVHAKSGSTTADNTRRTFDVKVLKDSLLAQYPGAKNAILGDYNDLVEGSISSGQISPYKLLTDNGYTALTLPLLQAGKGTFVGGSNPSMIDNIIISSALNGFAVASSTTIEDARDYINNYSTTTSDHLPIYTRFSFPTGTLPITLSSFQAKAMGNYVSLKWTTASETNNDFFTIERSADGKTFTKIKEEKGAGAIATTSPNNYSIIDENPLQGINYYRIRQTDLNGTSVVSDLVRSATILTAKASTFTVYPNPVTDKITLGLSTSANSVNLVVTSLDGKVLMNETGTLSSLNEKLNSKLANLSTGVYIVKLTADGQAYKTKFIKQ